MKGCFNPSPPFTHPSPSSFLESKRFSYIKVRSSMKTSSRHQWRPSFVISRRVCTYTLHWVKGGEGWWRVGEGLSKPFTSHTPSVYRGFRRKGEGWRVKLRVGFLRAKQLKLHPLFLIKMIVLSKFSSQRIILCPAMAQNCPSRGQYRAITRQ